MKNVNAPGRQSSTAHWAAIGPRDSDIASTRTGAAARRRWLLRQLLHQRVRDLPHQPQVTTRPESEQCVRIVIERHGFPVGLARGRAKVALGGRIAMARIELWRLSAHSTCVQTRWDPEVVKARFRRRGSHSCQDVR
jgi:hypothetical protein